MIGGVEGGEKMGLPDFETFLATINQDALQEIVEESIGDRIIHVDNLLEEGSFSTLMSEIIHQSVDISASISLIYLRTYHEWLQRQLEQ